MRRPGFSRLGSTTAVASLILAHILKTRAANQDRETIESLDALSTQIMASIGKT